MASRARMTFSNNIKFWGCSPAERSNMNKLVAEKKGSVCWWHAFGGDWWKNRDPIIIAVDTLNPRDRERQIQLKGVWYILSDSELGVADMRSYWTRRRIYNVQECQPFNEGSNHVCLWSAFFFLFFLWWLIWTPTVDGRQEVAAGLLVFLIAHWTLREEKLFSGQYCHHNASKETDRREDIRRDTIRRSEIEVEVDICICEKRVRSDNLRLCLAGRKDVGRVGETSLYR